MIDDSRCERMNSYFSCLRSNLLQLCLSMPSSLKKIIEVVVQQAGLADGLEGSDDLLVLVVSVTVLEVEAAGREGEQQFADEVLFMGLAD